VLSLKSCDAGWGVSVLNLKINEEFRRLFVTFPGLGLPFILFSLSFCWGGRFFVIGELTGSSLLENSECFVESESGSSRIRGGISNLRVSVRKP